MKYKVIMVDEDDSTDFGEYEESCLDVVIDKLNSYVGDHKLTVLPAMGVEDNPWVAYSNGLSFSFHIIAVKENPTEEGSTLTVEMLQNAVNLIKGEPANAPDWWESKKEAEEKGMTSISPELDGEGFVVEDGSMADMAEPKHLPTLPTNPKIKVPLATAPFEGPPPGSYGSHTGSHSVVCTDWGIDPYVNLEREAANFYVLYALSLDYSDDEAVTILLDNQVDKLKVNFANYLDMALGGELRHSRTRAKGVAAIRARSKEHKAILAAIQAKNYSRADAWAAWRKVRDEYGLVALEVAEQTFKECSWGGAYGGKPWGTAAEVLRHWHEGNITDIILVDTTWSLQHNCNRILDKVWQIPPSLKFILDCKVEDNIEPIVKYADKEVIDLWNSKVVEKAKASIEEKLSQPTMSPLEEEQRNTLKNFMSPAGSKLVDAMSLEQVELMTGILSSAAVITVNTGETQ